MDTKFLRNAELIALNGDNILDVLKEFLPEGYRYSQIAGSEYGFLDKIDTPSGDEIRLCIPDKSNQSVALTANILKQDAGECPPSLQDDELSQLARAIHNDENSKSKIEIIVHASDADLGIKN